MCNTELFYHIVHRRLFTKVHTIFIHTFKAHQYWLVRSLTDGLAINRHLRNTHATFCQGFALIIIAHCQRAIAAASGGWLQSREFLIIPTLFDVEMVKARRVVTACNVQRCSSVPRLVMFKDRGCRALTKCCRLSVSKTCTNVLCTRKGCAQQLACYNSCVHSRSTSRCRLVFICNHPMAPLLIIR